MTIDPDALKKLARAIKNTHDQEIDCDECFAELDRFVEMALAGKDTESALPLVQEHLDRCADCREELEALLAALSQSSNLFGEIGTLGQPSST